MPRVEPTDVVIQDDYTHDVLFRASDGSYLVFDTTCLAELVGSQFGTMNRARMNC